MVTAVSRSYTTLALGILLLGYLSTELLPHRALSLSLALCGEELSFMGRSSPSPKAHASATMWRK